MFDYSKDSRLADKKGNHLKMWVSPVDTSSFIIFVFKLEGKPIIFIKMYYMKGLESVYIGHVLHFDSEETSEIKDYDFLTTRFKALIRAKEVGWNIKVENLLEIL